MKTEPSLEINIKEKISIIRDMNRHENELLNQRLTWLGVFNGLFFTSLGIIINNNAFNTIYFLICFTGLFVSISIGVGCDKANRAIDELEKEFEKINPNMDNALYVIGVAKFKHIFSFFMPGFAIPSIFILVWTILIFVKALK